MRLLVVHVDQKLMVVNITVTYRSSTRPINYRVHYNIFQLFGASVTGSPGGLREA